MVQPLEGTVSVREILSYLDRDRFFDKRQASDYLSICVRSLEERLKEIPHFRVGAKILFKKSELDVWMERHRENPEAIDLDRLADEVVAEVLGKVK
jgi:excisionase family DNA binding protein